MKISDGNKVIFEGAFNPRKIDFTDSDNDELLLRYDDKDLLNDKMLTALYDFMCRADCLGNNDDLTKFYLYNNESDGFALSAFCKPVIFDYEAENEQSKKMLQKIYDKSNDEKEKAWIKKTIKEDEMLNKECADCQRDMLDELEEYGGYAITSFCCDFSDNEQKQLEKVFDSMFVKS